VPVYFLSVGVKYIFTIYYYTLLKRLLMKLKLTLLCIGILFCCLFQQAIAQTLSVSGKVKNKATNEPLVSASIVVQGGSGSTVTDAAGNFSITVQKGSTLVISYAGMEAVRYKVNNAVAINIQMEEATKSLNEVVVVGYGTQKVTKVSGAISTVKAADIEKLKPVRVEDALQGRASGVTVISPGSPGAKPTVLIRGIPASYTHLRAHETM
jgi:hypothetical protein